MIETFGFKVLSEHGKGRLEGRTCPLLDECEVHSTGRDKGARSVTYDIEKFEQICTKNYESCKIYKRTIQGAKEDDNAIKRQQQMFNSVFLGGTI